VQQPQVDVPSAGVGTSTKHGSLGWELFEVSARPPRCRIRLLSASIRKRTGSHIPGAAGCCVTLASE
jgi:hypothetical protein